MNFSSLDDKWVLVTGAASGIGRETALLAARRGAHLALCDVDDEGLAGTRAQAEKLGSEVIAEHVDVANAEEMRAFAGTVHARIPAVDLLVNNAGVALGGGFLESSLEDWRWILGINLEGVIHGCHFFVPAMVERASGGHVVNVSSAAGYFASAALCAYSTTKFGVLGLSEALRDELESQGIGVTTVCPGVINTAITRSARLRGEGDTEVLRQEIVGAYQRRGYGPERVAQGILRAVVRNRAVAPITPEAWALYWAKRFAPRATAWLGHRATLAQERRRLLE